MHYRARYYDVETGSFLSRDPIGIWEDEANLGNGYTYVGNNPVMSTDPSGECGSWKNGYIGGCLWGVGTAIGNAGVSLGKTYLDCQNNGLKTCGKNIKSSTQSQATAFKKSVSATGSCLTGKNCQDLCTSGSSLNFVANLSCGYHACGQETHMGRQMDCYVSANIDFALADAALVAPVASRITAVANPVPTRLARVIDEEYSNTPGLGRPGEPRVFVTAADDIAGIRSSDQLARRLTLVDNEGNYRKGPFAVFEFDTPNTGLGSPIARHDPGFVGRGRTAGGAREFDMPNYRFDELSNLHQRFLE